MTRQLHTDKNAFREITTLAADTLGYEQSHVEKDYWLSKILKDICISDYKDKTYFKGGTSLSKAYGLIERFSEDLDLFVFTGNVKSSKQAEKTLNKKVTEFIIEHSGCTFREELSKRGGNFNMLCFSYANLFNYVGLKGNLEVEIKACDLADKTEMYYPTELRRIEPIVGQYLEGVGRADLMEEFGLEGFETWCISPKRTICDKILRLARVSHGENAVEQIVKYIRDIYDLTVILRNDDYSRFVASEDFCKAISLVTQEDSLNRNYPSGLSPADADIFRNAGETMSLPRVKTAYEIDLSKLLFINKQLSPTEEVVSALEYFHTRLQDVNI